jgi:hypothetical protein
MTRQQVIRRMGLSTQVVALALFVGGLVAVPAEAAPRGSANQANAQIAFCFSDGGNPDAVVNEGSDRIITTCDMGAVTRICEYGDPNYPDGFCINHYDWVPQPPETPGGDVIAPIDTSVAPPSGLAPVLESSLTPIEEAVNSPRETVVEDGAAPVTEPTDTAVTAPAETPVEEPVAAEEAVSIEAQP